MNTKSFITYLQCPDPVILLRRLQYGSTYPTGFHSEVASARPFCDDLVTALERAQPQGRGDSHAHYHPAGSRVGKSGPNYK